MIITKKCLACDKELLKNQKSFCSRNCFFNYQDKRIIVNCATCRKSFKEKTCRIKNNRGKFCSKECYWKSLLGRNLSPNTEFKKGQKLSEETKLKMLGRIPWNKDKEFKQIQKENHWNWKGGRTDLRIAIRMLFKYKEWRSMVFIRDNHTCQKCGARRCPGNRVVIHCDHIKPFYKILEENNITTLEQAKECKELWNVDNGRTLCVPCHKLTPSYLVNQYTK